MQNCMQPTYCNDEQKGVRTLTIHDIILDLGLVGSCWVCSSDEQWCTPDALGRPRLVQGCSGELSGEGNALDCRGETHRDRL